MGQFLAQWYHKTLYNICICRNGNGVNSFLTCNCMWLGNSKANKVDCAKCQQFSKILIKWMKYMHWLWFTVTVMLDCIHFMSVTEINSHDIPLQTSESRPSVITMRKNRTDQSGAAGIVATALVYTTNANPVPVKNVRRNSSLFKVTENHSCTCIR